MSTTSVETKSHKKLSVKGLISDRSGALRMILLFLLCFATLVLSSFTWGTPQP